MHSNSLHYFKLHNEYLLHKTFTDDISCVHLEKSSPDILRYWVFFTGPALNNGVGDDTSNYLTIFYCSAIPCYFPYEINFDLKSDPGQFVVRRLC